MENIKVLTGDFYEVVVKYLKTQEDGSERLTKETVAVKANSFGEAEKDTQTGYIPQVDINIVNINPAPYRTIFTSDNTEDELFFKCKVAFLTIDEVTEKEKKDKVVYLFQASSTRKAQKYIEEAFGSHCYDYKIESIVESPVVDIFNLSDTHEHESL